MGGKITIAHGGALAAAVIKYGGNKADWLDLSTGINPVSAPLPDLASSVWQALPDTDLMNACLAAARTFYRLNSDAALVAAPGVQAVIQLLPYLRPGKKAAILGATYGEYAHVFQTLGSGCRIINSIDELMDENVVVVVNPNNPDGKTTESNVLLQFVEKLSASNGLLIVDEAFCDITAALSVTQYAGISGLLILKSFGKFFGLAGVRLGFAAGHTDDIAILSQHLGPWAVSGPALVIGEKCYADTELRAKIAQSIKDNSKKQHAVLTKFNLDIIADTGLFQLIKTGKASSIYEGLAPAHSHAHIFKSKRLVAIWALQK